jgi:hypothetical protein
MLRFSRVGVDVAQADLRDLGVAHLFLHGGHQALLLDRA